MGEMGGFLKTGYQRMERMVIFFYAFIYIFGQQFVQHKRRMAF